MIEKRSYGDFIGLPEANDVVEYLPKNLNKDEFYLLFKESSGNVSFLEDIKSIIDRFSFENGALFTLLDHVSINDLIIRLKKIKPSLEFEKFLKPILVR